MSDHAPSTAPLSFDSLIGGSAPETVFTTAFRGYDKEEVDATLDDLRARAVAAQDEIAKLKDDRHRAASALGEARRRVTELQSVVDTAQSHEGDEVAQLRAQLADAEAARDEAAEAARAERGDELAQLADQIAQLKDELTAAQTQTADAQKQVQVLSEELSGSGVDTPNRPQFEEILRVAEEQASTLIRNASVQGDRLLQAARVEIENSRAHAQADAEAIISQAQHEAQQSRLRIETELAAHEAQLEREAARSAEKVEQAQQEAAAIRSEAEKGAAALRAMVARETSRDRGEAEEAVRELRVRTLEFEESLTRRQDDAHQEFLVLHNQAVAHAERITADANEQVAASLEHAKRVSSKADDYEKLARAQAQQIEADARVRAADHLDSARTRAQKIIDMVTSNAQSVLHDAEDRTRQLRWQQHQLTSFMAEVRELIRPAGLDGASIVGAGEEDAAPAADGSAERDGEVIDEATGLEQADGGADADADGDAGHDDTDTDADGSQSHDEGDLATLDADADRSVNA
ncbi:DivIVA domain-containing protein [Microbacterium terrisoli]|jgi:DivIVA domain-containing protein|uniref:DivIVA domain-containing protein n=1 Tax=Microbacterium terrisoli TaxID=3242192 RepID=UPI00280411F2|nr:DivIVA domain-containing protein [Microbacterium protaetiae]